LDLDIRDWLFVSNTYENVGDSQSVRMMTSESICLFRNYQINRELRRFVLSSFLGS
jgi:hypothetical protein